MTETKVMQATNIFVFYDRYKSSTISNPKCCPRQNKHMTGWKQEKNQIIVMKCALLVLPEK